MNTDYSKPNTIHLVPEPIVLIFGKICSGKSTYANALSYVTKAKHITVSDIVKRVSGATTRSTLQMTHNLDEAIAVELVKEIEKYGKVVVDGIRQKSIVDWLLKHFHRDDILMLWLDTPDEIREYRFRDRIMTKDDISFEQADQRDAELGLLELQEALKKQYVIINN